MSLPVAVCLLPPSDQEPWCSDLELGEGVTASRRGNEGVVASDGRRLLHVTRREEGGVRSWGPRERRPKVAVWWSRCPGSLGGNACYVGSGRVRSSDLESGEIASARRRREKKE